MTQEELVEEYIAIIGLAGRFPGAPDLERFWQLLCAGQEALTVFSDEELQAEGVAPDLLHDPDFVRVGGVLEHIDLFDAAFFGYTPREAEMIDPQQRLLLECAWEAMEDAGYESEHFSGRIGVYAGEGLNSYLLMNVASHLPPDRLRLDLSTFLGNGTDFAATRVAYKLNLRGPSVGIQTACSTSLVAVHLACQSLLTYQTDLSLVGGSSISVPQRVGYLYKEGGIVSPDGHCRPFDAAASGTVPGSGVGVVVLKRLSEALADGDNIRAVIRGSAINNDGANKVGFTAPSIDGQAAVIAEAQALADVDPESISYIEAHGTGTALGDPIELRALTQAFRARGARKRHFCALGSLKSNFGHMDTAAGIASLIKTVLALQHRQIPASLHCTHPTPAYDWDESPFYVNTRLQDWQVSPGDQPRRAGVSSFGIGGTNAHVVLEEAPPLPVREGGVCSEQLLVLSSRTPGALEAQTARLAAHLTTHQDLPLADVAATLQMGRRSLPERRFLVVHSAQDILNKAWTSAVVAEQPPAVVLLLPGQGSLRAGIGKELYETEATFRRAIDQCCAQVTPQLGLDLLPLLFPAEQRREEAQKLLQETLYNQPAQFILSYALAQLWQDWGVEPQAMLGHSLGEYVAACLAEVFTLEEALNVVVMRGKLLQKLPPGSMISISLPAEEVQVRLRPGLDIAACNAPDLTVVSGPTKLLQSWQQELQAEGVTCRPLAVTRAFHSALVEPVVPELVRVLRQVRLHAPRKPYISNVSGTWITTDQATDPDYWGRQLRAPVQFARGIETLLDEEARLFLEVGTGTSLGSLVRRQCANAANTQVVATMRHPAEHCTDRFALLTAVGRLWLAGIPVQWPAFAPQEWRRVALPTYPFERRSFWIARRATERKPDQALVDRPSPSSGTAPTPPASALYARPALPEQYVAPRTLCEQQIAAIWQEDFGIEPVGVNDDFFHLGGDSLLAVRLSAHLSEVLEREVPLSLIFEQPTIAHLAQALEHNPGEALAETPDPKKLASSSLATAKENM